MKKQRRVIGPGRHFPPQGRDEGGKARGVFIDFLEEFEKAMLRQEPDVLRKHGEETALEKDRDDFGIVLFRFERFRELREPVRDVAGDLGNALRRVERMRIGPDRTEELANLRLTQVFEGDPVIFRIGEALVASSGDGELGVEFENIADVADDEKRRSPLTCGKIADVALGLGMGARHRFIIARRAALPVAKR